MPTDPTKALSSMGNYIFNRDLLVETLIEDARRSTDHDFGRTIIPELYPDLAVFAYNFLANEVPGTKSHEEHGYWRDVGTIGAYWEAHMDLLGAEPVFDLDNPQWPVHSTSFSEPTLHLVSGEITDSLIAQGCRIEGATIRRSIIGRGVKVHPGAMVDECIIMDRTSVGRGARLRRVIADRYNLIPDGDTIGLDPARDAQVHQVDPSGIVVLPRGLTRYSS
jgi:glucose-1-phosphate adenylyltransferase